MFFVLAMHYPTLVLALRILSSSPDGVFCAGGSATDTFTVRYMRVGLVLF